MNVKYAEHSFSELKEIWLLFYGSQLLIIVFIDSHAC